MPIHSHNNKEIYISACSSHRIQFKKYSVFTNHNISLDCHSDQLRTICLCPLTLTVRHIAKGSHGQYLCCLLMLILCISSWKRLWLVVIFMAQREADKNENRYPYNPFMLQFHSLIFLPYKFIISSPIAYRVTTSKNWLIMPVTHDFPFSIWISEKAVEEHQNKL